MNTDEFQKLVLDELRLLRSQTSENTQAIGELAQTTSENTQTIGEITQAISELAQALKDSERSLTFKIESVMEVVMKTMDDVTAIRKDLSTVETVTASNYTDIVRLKAIR